MLYVRRYLPKLQKRQILMGLITKIAGDALEADEKAQARPPEVPGPPA